MFLGKCFRLSTAAARDATLILLFGVAACGHHDSDPSAPASTAAAGGDNAVAASGADAVAGEDAVVNSATSRFHVRLTHRAVRHRHAGPR
jgi:hypothetical protein